MQAVGYCRVSTDQQGDSGAGLEAQEAKIRAEADRRGWQLEIRTDVGSGKTMRRRPKLEQALELLERGDAQLLVVAKLDRLSRSMLDFAGLMATAKTQGWALVALDLGVDTSTPNGKLVASIIMAMAEWERELIGQRTKDALAAVKARGTQLGRPRNVDDGTVALIRTLRSAGRGYHSIAKILNESGVPTAQGGKAWYPATVRLIHERAGREAGVELEQEALPIESG